MIEYTPEVRAMLAGAAWLAGADACRAGEPIDGPTAGRYDADPAVAQAYRDGWTARAAQSTSAPPCVLCRRPSEGRTLTSIKGPLCEPCWADNVGFP